MSKACPTDERNERLPSSLVRPKAYDLLHLAVISAKPTFIYAEPGPRRFLRLVGLGNACGCPGKDIGRA